MAKTMAIITDGIVSNMIWCNDAMQETETRKDPGDRPVGIGDTYSDGRWYRDGVEILTVLEQAQKDVSDLQSQIAEMDAEYEAALSEIESALGVNT